MNEREVVDVLLARGALLEGHFLLSSGRHSDRFVQKFRVLEHPRLAQRFGESIAGLFRDAPFDVVAAPAIGAIVLGFATALAADARSVFAERVSGGLELRRGFSIAPRERVLVVEDVVTTGGSARETVDLVKGLGATVVGVGALIDRGAGSRSPGALGAPLRALAHLEVESWEPQRCPLCERGMPLADPGSRRAS